MKRIFILLCAGLVSCGLGRRAEKLAKEVESSSRDYLYSVVGTLMFSPSGKLVYVAKKGEGQVVVIDGTEGPLYDRITYIAFVPEFSYSVTSSPPTPLSSDLSRGSSDAWGPAGERLIYVAEKEGKKLMVDRGLPGKEYDDISDINFLPGGRVLYKAKKDRKFAIVVDTAEGKFYDGIGGITYNREHIAFWATEGDSSFVVLDGVEGPRYDRLPAGR